MNKQEFKDIILKIVETIETTDSDEIDGICEYLGDNLVEVYRNGYKFPIKEIASKGFWDIPGIDRLFTFFMDINFKDRNTPVYWLGDFNEAGATKRLIALTLFEQWIIDNELYSYYEER